MLKYSITQRNKARGDATWYGRIFDTASKRVRFLSLGTTLKRLADEWLRQKIAGEVAGVKESDIQMQKAIDDYLKNYTFRKSLSNLATAMHHLKIFCANNDVNTFSDLTPARCIEFFGSIKDLKASTRKMYLGNLSAFWRRCCKIYQVRGIENPFASVSIEKVEPSDRSFWTIEQIYTILDLAKTREDRLIFSLMAFAGLRIMEAYNIKGADIHDGKIYVVGKGSKFATIPVSNRLQAELDRYGDIPNGTMFKGISCMTYSSHLKAIFEKNHLDFGGKVHVHRFRHSFASNMVRAGISLALVMKAMRHSSIQMTMRYSHLAPDDLTEAINKV